MKYILKNVKNIIPYLLLVAVYFFFVNLEARKSQDRNLEENSSQKDEKKIKGGKYGSF